MVGIRRGNMLVAGLSDAKHGAGAAVFNCRGPVAATEEAKLRPSAGDADRPARALEQCLRQVGARPPDFSVVALAGRPRRARLREARLRQRLGGSQQNHGPFGEIERRAEHVCALRSQVRPDTPILEFEHHLCHASSAFYASPYDRALVLTLDQEGDMWSGLMAIGEGNDLQVMRALRFPDSLGWLYSQVTELLGTAQVATSTRHSGSVARGRRSPTSFRCSKISSARTGMDYHDWNGGFSPRTGRDGSSRWGWPNA